jgi:hypothetical protein
MNTNKEKLMKQILQPIVLMLVAVVLASSAPTPLNQSQNQPAPSIAGSISGRLLDMSCGTTGQKLKRRGVVRTALERETGEERAE